MMLQHALKSPHVLPDKTSFNHEIDANPKSRSQSRRSNSNQGGPFSPHKPCWSKASRAFSCQLSLESKQKTSRTSPSQPLMT